MSLGLIEADELARLLEAGKNVKIIDATYLMPGSSISARDLHRNRRLPDAVFFDIDGIADRDSPLPHMLPSPEDFGDAVAALGIGNDDFVVVYDQSGIAMAAARAWWTFRVFGHDRVCVLNGGLPYWQATGHPLDSGEPDCPAPASFKSSFRPELVSTLAEVAAASADGKALILDARSPERFSGQSEEPRPGLRSGHIPGSLNLPFMGLIDPVDGRLIGQEILKDNMPASPENTQTIASCGSGVTACVIALAYHRLGKNDVAVYDGSWVEWGQEKSGMTVAKDV